jgi:hypothetical protein
MTVVYASSALEGMVPQDRAEPLRVLGELEAPATSVGARLHATSRWLMSACVLRPSSCSSTRTRLRARQRRSAPKSVGGLTRRLAAGGRAGPGSGGPRGGNHQNQGAAETREQAASRVVVARDAAVLRAQEGGWSVLLVLSSVNECPCHRHMCSPCACTLLRYAHHVCGSTFACRHAPLIARGQAGTGGHPRRHHPPLPSHRRAPQREISARAGRLANHPLA